MFHLTLRPAQFAASVPLREGALVVLVRPPPQALSEGGAAGAGKQQGQQRGRAAAAGVGVPAPQNLWAQARAAAASAGRWTQVGAREGAVEG